MVGSGKFLISLDLELMWGVRDMVTPKQYGEHIKGVHTALPKILNCFKNYKIAGTFAAVGFLFFKDKNELIEYLPDLLPTYHDQRLSPYNGYIKKDVGKASNEDPYHYGHHLLELIKETPGQEICSHTFSHYYCLEPGQTIDQFSSDLKAAIVAAALRDIKLTSIIFPRNQVNEEYLAVCREYGFKVYRSNERSWLYTARPGSGESLRRRFLRLADSYINISGHHTYLQQYSTDEKLIEMPSSRFLRPYSKRFRFLENLRFNRIRNSMDYAAKNNQVYHLWFHPHNFGINQDENIRFLNKILRHYTKLKETYNFTSYTMSSLAAELSKCRED